jgi:type III secretion system YseE family protein
MGRKERITMTALERNLLDDKDGEAHRKQLMAKILQQRCELTALMNNGVSSEEYKAWNEFKQALDNALEVIECYR